MLVSRVRLLTEEKYAWEHGFGFKVGGGLSTVQYSTVHLGYLDVMGDDGIYIVFYCSVLPSASFTVHCH